MLTKTILSKSIITVVLLTATILLNGCDKRDQQPATKTRIVTAALQPVATHLSFSGTLQPLHNDNVFSPADGTVDKIYFKYGEVVQKGQLLMTLSSTKLQQDYTTALTDYIKAKDQYNRSVNSFQGTKMLWDAGIVTKESYLSDKSTLETNELALINSTNALKKAMQQIPELKLDFTQLTLENISTLHKILEKQADHLKIYATATGIALFSQTSTGTDQSSDNQSKTVAAGSEIKQGQVLVAIGDLKGITTEISVGELSINQIKPGQAATITSPALPGMILNGHVILAAAQAKSSTGGGGSLATFPVIIQVPQITDEQRKLIRVGMDAKVEITIKGEPQIKLPIAAIFQKDGVSMVTLQNPKTQQTQDVAVVTGQTGLDDVVIVKGIKPGDQVVVHD